MIELKSAVASEYNGATEQSLCAMKLATAQGKGMKDLGVMIQTGTREQPQTRRRGLLGEAGVGELPLARQLDKDPSVGRWEVGWRMQCITGSTYLSSPPNYKERKGNDLTTKPHLPRRKMGCRGGVVGLYLPPPLKHLSHKLAVRQHFKCSIPGSSFCL